jgi:D-alanyl-D-alanine carboxypeptidase (penicillin-binding protein 5/6)
MRAGRLRWIVGGLVVVLCAVVAFGAVALTRAAPRLRLVTSRLPRAFPGRLHGLAWPTQGQAAIAVRGVGVLGSRRSDLAAPIASVAKIMTAFVVLRDHPLKENGAGPEIRVTGADEATYRADRDTGQSTAAVRSGELLSERQALEALLLPSGNNMASLLARWDAGSEEAFVDRMNVRARELGMKHTHYSDASGFSSFTVSTARDQLRLAEAAIGIPALVQIASLPRARLPVAGDLENLDDLLGSHGVFGLKTGSTSAAGGCFVFAARVPAGRRMVDVVGAVLGQPGVGERELLDSAFNATTNLLVSARRVLRSFRSVAGRGVFGRIVSPWANPVAVRLLRLPVLVGWPGLAVRIGIRRAPDLRAPVRAGQTVGTAIVRVGRQRATVPLVASRALPEPSLGWRLTHP